jgi:hypothetical protein
VSSNRLGQPSPCSLAGSSPLTSLGQSVLAAYNFPYQIIHVLGTSNILGSPLHLQLSVSPSQELPTGTPSLSHIA